MQRNPAHLGVAPPKLMHVPNLRYVYDAIQNDRVTVAWKFVDISAVLVADVNVSPCPWGSTVASVAGGDIIGYDYLGQMTAETLTPGGSGSKAYAYIVSAPADALWENTFGLPYRTNTTEALDDISGHTVSISTAQVVGTGRGLWTASGAVTGDMVEFSYAVDTTNMHGDAFTDMAGPQPGEDAVTVAATVNNTGAIAITQAGVVAADDGATVTYQFPDGGQMTVTAADQTVNYTLSPLWLSKYGRNNILEEVLDGLVRASSSGGTHVIVDLTGSVAPSAQTAPIDSTPIEGPFNAFGTEFWVNTDTCKVGFDVDNDPDADTWFTWAEIDGNDDISDESKMAYKAQLEALGCTT